MFLSDAMTLERSEMVRDATFEIVFGMAIGCLRLCKPLALARAKPMPGISQY
jgi:hypothetical protein